MRLLVAMPVRKGEKFLDETPHHGCFQTRNVNEIIVVDDAS